MRIDREHLIKELTTFALNGNGLIVGPPGVGKTFALARAREQFKRDSILHLNLSVERLGRATDAEVGLVLGWQGDPIALLRSAATDAKQTAILIFDGFDAARGENERAGVLHLILRAVNELRGQWNTIVSVRTFDAKKSQRLLALFPDKNPEGVPTAGSCRQFAIPPLRVEELEQAFNQVPSLRELHTGGTQEFRTLLTVPFNLWLVERVIRRGAKAAEFSPVTSEVQLLQMYWDYRIRKAPHPEDREFILKKATLTMVEDHTLVISRARVYQPEVKAAWEGLLSDETLCEEVPDRAAHVTFTHNILFDFAVGAHLLDPDPVRLARFVADEPARPLFLRPSLVYHFTRLWHFDRESFWRNFWGIVQAQEIHLRQIIRIVLPAVVRNEAKTAEDLRPLLDRLAKNESPAQEAVAFLLQALRVLHIPDRALWANFIRAIGLRLDLRFAWDAGVLATGIVESEGALTSKAVADCGEFGRSLLRWAWSSRAAKDRKQWFERLAALVAIPLVAKTYATNEREARRLLEEVLQVVGETDFPIDCIWRLAECVEHLIPRDAELVSLIYERIFGYQEDSQQVANKGGPVFSFTVSRHDDYGMCQYSLMKAFPRFLATKPWAALRAGIRAIQAFAVRHHVLRHLQDGKTLDDLTLEFRFRSSNAHYVEDGSYVWDESSYPDRELEIADGVFNWLGSAAGNCRIEDIDRFLELFLGEAKLAFLWARLLASGAANPAVLGPRLWELAIAKPILEENGAFDSLKLFLEHAVEFLSEAQRREIEQAILGLAQHAGEEERAVGERRRDRLVACIPTALLVTTEAAELRTSLERESKLPPNRPLFSVSSSFRPYTEDEYLRDQGAKPDSPANQEILRLSRPLREWGEKNKEESQIDALMPTACALRSLLARENGADAAVLRAAWAHLASFASGAILRAKSADTERFRKLREIVLDAAAHPDPPPNPTYDASWNSATWSPAPRNEAAQAVPWLTHFGEDEEALAAIQKLANDPVPSVRFLLACELWRLFEHRPDLMWSILDAIAEKETNAVVLQGVTVSLWKLIRPAKARSLTLIGKLLERMGEASDGEEKAQSHLVCMVVDYAVWEDNQWAKDTIARWRSKPLGCAGKIATSGRRLAEYVKPAHSGAQLERARELLLAHLDAVAQGLTALQQDEAGVSKDEIQNKWRALYGVIDEVVTLIYFAADVNPNLQERKEHPLDDDSRMTFFRDALPILEKVLSFGRQPETGMLFAPTAHHLMELLNGVLRYDPALILRLAAEVVACSKRFNYNLDSMAMGEIVKLVESILTDYRDKVQEEQSIKHLLEILDAFVEAGWPEALNLVWRLDEIYR